MKSYERTMPNMLQSLRRRGIQLTVWSGGPQLELRVDNVAVTLKRTKGQYDGTCQEVESRRKKVESSFDSRSAVIKPWLFLLKSYSSRLQQV